jgi:hypothetical protein
MPLVRTWPSNWLSALVVEFGGNLAQIQRAHAASLQGGELVVALGIFAPPP